MYGGLHLSARTHIIRGDSLGHDPARAHHPVRHPVQTGKLDALSRLGEGDILLEERAGIGVHLQITVRQEIFSPPVAIVSLRA